MGKPGQVQWIKLHIGMFDGESFKSIRQAKGKGLSRDRLTAIWTELLDLAGRLNCGGCLINARGVVLDAEAIAVQLCRKRSELAPCLDFFVAEGMLTYDEQGYRLTNWERYQNVEALEQVRKKTRERVRRYREKKAGNAEVTPEKREVTPLEEEIEADTEKEIQPFFLIEGENEAAGSNADVRKPMGGTLGQNVVLLSDAQTEDLLQRMSLAEFDHYAQAVAQAELSGKHYRKKTHYQAMLEMAEHDRGIRRRKENAKR